MIFLVGLPVTLGLFSLYVATRPGAFRIARSLTIDAPASALFPLINDFHEWPAWSPFEHLDPAMTKAYEGAASGQGARYTWSGNNKAGSGTMTIVESSAPSKIEIELAFTKPFAATNKATFTLEPKGNGTEVTWVMEGTRNFAFKAVGVFMNMDDMVGQSFAQGLAALRDAAAKRAESVPAVAAV